VLSPVVPPGVIEGSALAAYGIEPIDVGPLVAITPLARKGKVGRTAASAPHARDNVFYGKRVRGIGSRGETILAPAAGPLLDNPPLPS
jgi:hypothetical protein